jgi:ATP-dependent exoDNAse (exonuclease V) beta subunit
VEQRERVLDQDESEVVRVAYVAATRAKEMLVVPTCGDHVIEGWLEPLVPALYPPREAFRRPDGQAPGTPKFAGDSVLAWPMDAPHDPEQSVAPGLHRPQSGDHRVVWWDPHFLEIKRPPVGGLTQQELLLADEQHGRDQQGMQDYQRWVLARHELRTRSGVPSWVGQSITQAAHDAQRAGARTLAALEVIDSGAQREGRPSGARFGTLVHALLERARPGSDRAELQGLASYVGRGIGATAIEQERAVDDTLRALSHPLWQRVHAAEERKEVFREYPVTLCESDGTLLDGVIDLAFRDRDPQGASEIVVVDFKTDVQIADLTAYQRQLALYCQALGRVFSEPCRAVLFRV